MRIKSLTVLLAGLMGGTLMGIAQPRAHVGHRLSHTTKDIVTQYMDSLTQFKAHQDSMDIIGFAPAMTVSASKPLGIEYNTLFMPATFYKGVPHRFFDLNSTTTELDEALLDLYLYRPDLVVSTESQLGKAGDIRQPVTVNVNHAPEIVEKVAPKPEDATVTPMDLVVLKPNFWNYSGDYYLQFLQNCISSNWYKGGESNYSMVGSLTLKANYNNKQKVRWDNKLEVKLGFQTSRQDTLHSLKVSENLLRLTSKLGLQATKRWYYTVQMVTYTQFMRQWKSNSNTVTTDFLGPLNVNVSIGMDYNANWFKNRLKGSIHLAPLAYNFLYVNRVELAGRYGIDKGKRQLHNFGSQFTIDMNWKFSDNISWKTRLYGYTTYERTELEWENTFAFRFNKWISSNIFVYPRFDDARTRDDHHGYFQYKEYASLGISYSF